MLLPAAGSAPRLQQEPDRTPLARSHSSQPAKEQLPGASLANALVNGMQPRSQTQLCEVRQGQDSREQSNGHAKVLTWLSISSSEPADTIPAAAQRSRPAAPAAIAAQVGAGVQTSPRLSPTRVSSMSAPRLADPLRRPPAHASPPAAQPTQPASQLPLHWQQPHRGQQTSDYCPRLGPQAAWQPPKLSLVRPPCAQCRKAEADCCCHSADTAPLRLLRPRQPAYNSPFGRLQRRRVADHCSASPSNRGPSEPVSHQRRCVALQAAAPAPGQAAQSQGGINIASIGTAYFGGSHPSAAPRHAAPALHCPANGSSSALGASHSAVALQGHQRSCPLHGPQPASCGGRGGLDAWAAYLASRKQPTGGSAADMAATGAVLPAAPVWLRAFRAYYHRLPVPLSCRRPVKWQQSFGATGPAARACTACGQHAGGYHRFPAGQDRQGQWQR